MQPGFEQGIPVLKDGTEQYIINMAILFLNKILFLPIIDFPSTFSYDAQEHHGMKIITLTTSPTARQTENHYF